MKSRLNAFLSAIIMVVFFCVGCNKHEDEVILVSSVMVSPENLTLEVGGASQLKANVLPESANNKLVLWKSEDESIATIDEAGNITALKVGIVTISATAQDGSGVTGKCVLTINNATVLVNAVVITPASADMQIGGTLELVHNVMPNDATNKDVLWSSSDESVATVDQTGKVTAVKDGKVSIFATSVDGSDIKGESVITVLVPAPKMYILGYGRYGADAMKYLVWRDGKITQLPENCESVSSFYSNGSSLYMAGIKKNNDKKVIGYWLGDTFHAFNDGSNRVTVSGIYANGSDVFISGREYDSATSKYISKLWKNGSVFAILYDGGTELSRLFGKGNDVYVTGCYYGESNARVPVYWKNGQQVGLDYTNEFSYPQSIFVDDNNDVHVVGFGRDATSYAFKAFYWKNNEAVIKLPDLSRESSALDVCVIGNDIHVVGDVDDADGNIYGAHWINGELVNQVKNAQFTSIYKQDNDIYITGLMVNSSEQVLPACWKNGVLIDIQIDGITWGKAVEVAFTK